MWPAPSLGSAGGSFRNLDNSISAKPIATSDADCVAKPIGPTSKATHAD
jgi:hypothetical protein